MTILRFPNQPKEPPFFKEVRKNGYHIFSRKNVEKPDFYPKELPDYPVINLTDLKENDRITVRVFFKIGSGKTMRVEGGYIDLEIELVEGNGIMGVVLTKLPEEFALEKGGSIEIFEDEILYKIEEE